MRRKSTLLFLRLIWMALALTLYMGCATTKANTTQAAKVPENNSQAAAQRGDVSIPSDKSLEPKINVHTIPSIAERRNLGTLTIVPAQYSPKSNFYTFAEGALAGAQKGAIEGGTATVFGSGAALGFTAIAMPAAFAFAAPVAIVGLTISAAAAAVAVTVEGGVKGAAIPENQREQMKASIADAVVRLDAQHVFARRMDAYVKTDEWIRLKTVDAIGPRSASDNPVYSRLHDSEGINTVLETTITEIGFDGCGRGFDIDYCRDGSTEPMVFLFIVVKARLVRVTDGTELYSNLFRHDSPPRKLAEWAASDAELFAEELERGYRDLAERMNDELFLITPLDLPVHSIWTLPSDPFYAKCWLRPIYPEPEYRIASLEGWMENAKTKPLWPPLQIRHISGLMYTAVDSRSPTLRWSEFPREIDREKLDPAILKGIMDVTYDLKIWEAVNGSRGKLVYARIGLQKPEHHLESALDPNSRYFWSFRARFFYEGQPMATRWSRHRVASCDEERIMDMRYYRFITPN